jgi:hypothetical protein
MREPKWLSAAMPAWCWELLLAWLGLNLKTPSLGLEAPQVLAAVLQGFAAPNRSSGGQFLRVWRPLTKVTAGQAVPLICGWAPPFLICIPPASWRC